MQQGRQKNSITRRWAIDSRQQDGSFHVFICLYRDFLVPHDRCQGQADLQIHIHSFHRNIFSSFSEGMRWNIFNVECKRSFQLDIQRFHALIRHMTT